ncbi:helix-hairpin-helix domain-containing protein [Maribellus sp. YY47]|uniref:helix-hairpin-helix domain-containing protein n=1 Tax=Maribellus sp. YY47 TaxID=2929486 RepID=UPI002000A6F5|nr:helix-hairpin-helix domain-containing protein [Maribellus sp. YY47]MCK3682700.1 helix-hairpin-helix domain-containing protein [Maribellus sp. YY47]
MKRTPFHITILLIVGISLTTNAQELSHQEIIENTIESQLENLEEEADAALMIEDLERLIEHPINLNSTNSDELSKMYLLNSIQIKNLLAYLEEYGPAYSIYELNTIDGFTTELLQKMQVFVVFGPKDTTPASLSEEIKRNRQELMLRSLGTLQKERGYKPNDDGIQPYEGNRFRYYSRYRFEAGDKLSAGLTAEKDPGEAFFKGSNKQGFDFYSGNVSMKINKTFERLTIGDFVIRSGQGLVLWQGFSPGKSADVLGIIKYGQGVRPYTSVDENLYFRGATTSFQLKKNTLHLFVSQKKADGNLDTDQNGEPVFTSLQTSGYHRTPSEIDDEKSVRYRNAGLVFSRTYSKLKLGSIFIYQDFDRAFYPGDQLYNRYKFNGTTNYTGGIDYLLSTGKYQLLGEAAVSKSGGKAFLQGIVAHLNDRLNLAAQFRSFDKNYQALWGQAISESSTVANETGFYLGARFLPAKFVTLSAYSDLYRSPWISYTTAGPSSGHDIFAQADFILSQKLKGYLRIKSETKDQKNKAEKLYVNLPEHTRRIRLHTEYFITDNWRWSSRFEHSSFNGVSKEHGILIFQDVLYKPQGAPLSLSGRIAYFNTSNYDARIYAYENDLLHTFSVPAFFGKGWRTYLNLKYKISDGAECWIKLANTRWTNGETIGSGYNGIAGKDKTEVKMQLRLKF